MLADEIKVERIGIWSYSNTQHMSPAAGIYTGVNAGFKEGRWGADSRELQSCRVVMGGGKKEGRRGR